MINTRFVGTPYINSLNESTIVERKREIESHPAWHGSLDGLACEDTLRGQPTGSFLIRHAEKDCLYYLSWVEDAQTGSFKHQPFYISDKDGQFWEHKNCVLTREPKLDKIIPKMMHRDKENCYPISKY